MSKPKFGEYLITKGVVNQETLDSALRQQKYTKDKLGQSLVKEGFVRKERLNLLLSGYFGMDYLSLSEFTPQAEAVALIPQYIARKINIVPVRVEQNILTIAACEPLLDQVNDNLRRITGKHINTVFMDEESLNIAFKYVYKNLDDNEASEDFNLQTRMVNLDAKDIVEEILAKASSMEASDIHFEPEREQLRIRFRIDGSLKTIEILPDAVANLIISRIKVLSGMNIAERRSPQDAALTYELNRDGMKIRINARVSTIPSSYGEKLALRMQTKGKFESLESLGLEEDHLKALHTVLANNQGIFLTTGPSGSGKTTTLYAALQLIRSDALNIITIEDPIERPLRGIIQTEVDYQKYNYETALRAILRQDPDVIMVGEIRDGETARLALHAAMTGHLVLSTFHTNDATSAVAQFVEMGCEQFIVNAAINAVLAQRLVRQLCPDCKVSYKAPQEELIALGLDPNSEEIFYKSEGCPSCHGLQYRGRIGLYELLIIDSGFKKMVSENADPLILRNYARKNGLRTLREDGLIKMRKGLTSFSEVIVATPND